MFKERDKEMLGVIGLKREREWVRNGGQGFRDRVNRGLGFRKRQRWLGVYRERKVKYHGFGLQNVRHVEFRHLERDMERVIGILEREIGVRVSDLEREVRGQIDLEKGD